MKKIIICGDGKDRAITRKLVDLCSRYGGAMVCGRNIYETCRRPEYIIVCTDTLAGISCSSCVVILGSDPAGKDVWLRDSVCVIDASDIRAVRFAEELGLPSVGCSVSGSDTVTLSSVSIENDFCISLNRSLEVVGSKGREKVDGSQEFIIRSSGEIYPILACGAALLLTGKASEMRKN